MLYSDPTDGVASHHAEVQRMPRTGGHERQRGQLHHNPPAAEHAEDATSEESAVLRPT